MKKQIESGAINKNSTWKELKKLLGKDIKDIKNAIEAGVVGIKKIGTKSFAEIFGALK